MTYSAWAAGDRITAARLNQMVGQWTDYTCIWSADTGTTTLGDGILAARYLAVGNRTEFRIKFQWGTTTTQSVAGANWHFSLPSALLSPVSTLEAIHAWVLDSSANLRYVACGYADTAGDYVSAIVTDGNGGFADDATPMVWASGDRLNIWGSYEAT